MFSKKYRNKLGLMSAGSWQTHGGARAGSDICQASLVLSWRGAAMDTTEIVAFLDQTGNCSFSHFWKTYSRSHFCHAESVRGNNGSVNSSLQNPKHDSTAFRVGGNVESVTQRSHSVVVAIPQLRDWMIKSRWDFQASKQWMSLWVNELAMAMDLQLGLDGVSPHRVKSCKILIFSS